AVSNVQHVESSIPQLTLPETVVEPTPPPPRPEMDVASTSGKKGPAMPQRGF
ncbi:hypothetical protein FRC17_005244, partial [Serendipita sp. 399]